jgi:hypothetical protein
MAKLNSGYESVSSNSPRMNEYLQTICVTLTLEVGSSVLDAICRLDVLDIRAKLFNNPSMRDKVTVRTVLLCKRCTLNI